MAIPSGLPDSTTVVKIFVTLTKAIEYVKMEQNTHTLIFILVLSIGIPAGILLLYCLFMKIMTRPPPAYLPVKPHHRITKPIDTRQKLTHSSHRNHYEDVTLAARQPQQNLQHFQNDIGGHIYDGGLNSPFPTESNYGYTQGIYDNAPMCTSRPTAFRV